MSSLLQDLRGKLDNCDGQLQKLFQERMEIIQKVAAYKKEQKLPIYDPRREAEILSRYAGSEQEFFRTLLRLSRYEQSLVLFPYNIVLIGFMGVGKTTVGAKLAQHLGREFLDLDELLEKRFEMTISQYFANQGEGAFRREEGALIQELRARQGVVIATGGGAILNSKNVETLKQQGRLVLLTATPQTITARLQGDRTRPVLGGEVTEEGIATILSQRKSAYAQAAQYTISTDQLTIEEVVDAVLTSLAQADN